LRDLKVSYNESSEFYFENLQKKLQNNGWANAWDIVLGLIDLSFNSSRPKWSLRGPMVEGNMDKFEIRSVYSNLNKNFCLNACVLLRRESIVATPDPIFCWV
jgi:hypothetical protein